MRTLRAAMVLCAASCLSSCVHVPAGHEVVFIKQPWLAGHGGVSSEAAGTGLSWVAPTTDTILVSLQPLQFQIHFDDLMSMDGVPLVFDAILRVRITNSVVLIKNFGTEWYKNNVEREFANRVRQAVRKHGMNETAISTVAIDAIDAEVRKEMASYFELAKLPLVLMQVTVGKANPPDSIKHQRIETAAQQQRILTEGQRKMAEDARKEAERSRAVADNAYREAMQLSPDQFLKLETIKMQQSACAAKDSHCTFILGAPVSPVVDARR